MTATIHGISPLVVLLGVVLALAVVWDFATARIPNWLTLTAAAGALAWQTASGGMKGMIFSASGWLLGVVLLLLPWLLGGLGAGDAKLMGTVGAFLGPKGCFVAFLGTALVGGVAALLLLAWHGILGPACRRWLRMGVLLTVGQAEYEAPSPAERTPRLRYGFAIAFGTIGALLLRDRLPGPLSLSSSLPF